jgi:hypothetical protein
MSQTLISFQIHQLVRGRHTIGCILYICSLDYLTIWSEEGRSDSEFRIRGICPVLGYVGCQKSRSENARRQAQIPSIAARISRSRSRVDIFSASVVIVVVEYN